jgi:hypothetical protein
MKAPGAYGLHALLFKKMLAHPLGGLERGGLGGYK